MAHLVSCGTDGCKCQISLPWCRRCDSTWVLRLLGWHKTPTGRHWFCVSCTAAWDEVKESAAANARKAVDYVCDACHAWIRTIEQPAPAPARFSTSVASSSSDSFVNPAFAAVGQPARFGTSGASSSSDSWHFLDSDIEQPVRFSASSALSSSSGPARCGGGGATSSTFAADKYIPSIQLVSPVTCFSCRSQLSVPACTRCDATWVRRRARWTRLFGIWTCPNCQALSVFEPSRIAAADYVCSSCLAWADAVVTAPPPPIMPEPSSQTFRLSTPANLEQTSHLHEMPLDAKLLQRTYTNGFAIFQNIVRDSIEDVSRFVAERSPVHINARATQNKRGIRAQG